MPTAPSIFGKELTATRLLEFARHCNTTPRIKHARAFYAMAQKEVAGPWWGDCPTSARAWDVKRPVNSLGNAIRTYCPHLLGDRIDPIIEPAGIGTRGSAKMLEMRLRQWADDSGYNEEDEQGVIDALLYMAVWYIGRRDGGQGLAIDDTTVDVGHPFVQRIGLDNFVYDPNTNDLNRGTLCGHYYDVDRQAMLEAGIGDEKTLKDLPNVWDANSREDGGSGDSTEEGSRTRAEEEYLDDRVGLWDLCYMHRGRRFCCTVGPFNGGTDFVVKPYELVDEPEGWRYVTCGLDRMPGRTTPVSPAMTLMDYHLAREGVICKLVKEIEELDRTYVVKPGAQALAMKLTTPRAEGESRYIAGDPNNIKEMVQGGMTEEAIAAFGLLTAMGKENGPNVDVLGGQDGEASESATSTSIRAGNGAIVMGRWKSKVNEARTKIMRRVAAMLLQGGDRRTLVVKNPATGSEIPVEWDASTFDLSYDQFKYKVKLTSATAGMDPRAKLRSIIELYTQAIPAAVQTSMMLGQDPSKAIRILSDISGFAELDELIPTADGEALKASILQWMMGRGQAAAWGVGMGGMGPPGLGPATKVGQLNSDGARGIPV